MSLAVAQVLDDALEVINERGWCQDTLEDGEGRVCAVGAVNYAIYGRSSSWDTYPSQEELELAGAVHHALRENIDAASNNWVIDVIFYNNTPGRSIEDIKLWFKQAAEAERES